MQVQAVKTTTADFVPQNPTLLSINFLVISKQSLLVSLSAFLVLVLLLCDRVMVTLLLSWQQRLLLLLVRHYRLFFLFTLINYGASSLNVHIAASSLCHSSPTELILGQYVCMSIGPPLLSCLLETSFKVSGFQSEAWQQQKEKQRACAETEACIEAQFKNYRLGLEYNLSHVSQSSVGVKQGLELKQRWKLKSLAVKFEL